MRRQPTSTSSSSASPISTTSTQPNRSEYDLAHLEEAQVRQELEVAQELLDAVRAEIG
jgi:hypothetical protein